MQASQIFYYIKRNTSEASYAYETVDGLTVPIFSSMGLAQNFLQIVRIRGHEISLISPTQMEAFSLSCKALGVKFLQLDPKPNVLKTAKIKDIGGVGNFSL